MSLELEIPFETEEGYQYLVSFKEFPPNYTNCNIPIIDVSITLLSSNIESNSLKTLNKFISIVLDYLNTNNVIIYFYCDSSPIRIRQNRKKAYSNQEFRFNLFSTMFSKMNSTYFYLQEIIITDNTNGNHYTCLMSRISNQNVIELIKLELEKFNK